MPITYIMCYPSWNSAPGPRFIQLAGSIFLQVNSMTFKNQVVSGFGTALAILILVGALSYRNIVEIDRGLGRVARTHLVIEKLDSVRNNMLNIESAERGYILAGEAAYLEPYNMALDRIPGD